MLQIGRSIDVGPAIRGNGEIAAVISRAGQGGCPDVSSGGTEVVHVRVDDLGQWIRMQSTEAGDNGDGRADIAWYEGSNNGTVKVSFANGSGSMGSSVDWFSGWSMPDWAAVLD